jgi:hypothetical protein
MRRALGGFHHRRAIAVWFTGAIISANTFHQQPICTAACSLPTALECARMATGLHDKVVLITGANNPLGIGAATAHAFAREGAKVALT